MWLLVLVNVASAFDTVELPSGASIRWAEMPVAYGFRPAHAPGHLHPESQRAAVDAAFGVWQAVDGTELSFAPEPSSTNTVAWAKEWAYDPDVLAITSTWATEDGAIVGFEVHLNAAHPDWSIGPDGRDLQNALTHEVGHALGLDHTTVAEATMFPTTEAGDLAKRDLSLDDEDGARFLYEATPASPPPELPFDLPAGCATAPVTPSALALLLTGALLRRRNRSTP